MAKATAQPASVSARNVTNPPPLAIRLAERSTVRIARDMRSRISPSRLNDLTMRAPSTVSPIVCTICVEPS